MPYLQQRRVIGSAAIGHGGLHPTAQGMAAADAAYVAVLERFVAALPDRADGSAGYAVLVPR